MKTRLIVRLGQDETGEDEEFTWDLFPLVSSADTAHLDEQGLPKVGTSIRPGMIVIGKWGKTQHFDKDRLPSALEMQGLHEEELTRKYGHYWKNTSLYASPSMAGIVSSAYFETIGTQLQAVVELDCLEKEGV